MIEFGDSLKPENGDFSNKKQLFYEFLQNNEENLPFLKMIEKNTLLYNIYQKSFDSVAGSLTLDVFIEDLLQNIRLLHERIVAESTKYNKIKENIRILEAILKKMEEKNNESESKNEKAQEDLMFFISYVKDKNMILKFLIFVI